jgi:flagellar hook-length control protein FliK
MAKDEKGSIQSNLSRNSEKTDKPGKSNPLKNRGYDSKSNAEEAVKSSEHIVSRETISMTSVDKKSNTNQNDDLSSKGVNSDKAFAGDIIKSNLKSGLDSESSTGQQHAGYSTHNTERLNFVNKFDDNLALRNNLQQQIDQMMQKAKVIIRDNGNAQLTAKLNPRELGEISIKLTLVNGKLTGKFTVDNDFVQKELNSKLAQIFEELKAEGFSIDGFQVDVRSEAGNNSSFQETVLNSANKNFNKYGLHSSHDDNDISFSTDAETMERHRGEIYA